ncbi:hypothetical protein CHS0354_033109 [Potamilus streckersoni]|uniref:Uncharacterized protein n=1 Tax=Potamilus streckersoni TaxID=2493646 RepID=A0AAE0VQZ5_9BIVA|nr:hypothetical protein CHS0354_033109 [Potamilus streckersoni]
MFVPNVHFSSAKSFVSIFCQRYYFDFRMKITKKLKEDGRLVQTLSDTGDKNVTKLPPISGPCNTQSATFTGRDISKRNGSAARKPRSRQTALSDVNKSKQNTLPAVEGSFPRRKTKDRRLISSDDIKDNVDDFLQTATESEISAELIRLQAKLKHMEHLSQDRLADLNRQNEPMEQWMEKYRESSDALARQLRELIRVRDDHSRYKEEATRCRVQHKTNELASALYTVQNEKVQQDIWNIRDRVLAIKERNRVGHTTAQLKAHVKKMEKDLAVDRVKLAKLETDVKAANERYESLLAFQKGRQENKLPAIKADDKLHSAKRDDKTSAKVSENDIASGRMKTMKDEKPLRETEPKFSETKIIKEPFQMIDNSEIPQQTVREAGKMVNVEISSLDTRKTDETNATGHSNSLQLQATLPSTNKLKTSRISTRRKTN